MAVSEPSPELDLRIVAQGTTRSVTPTGEIDALSVGLVAEALGGAIADRPETLVLDLAGVSFMDSAGIHLVVDAQRRAEAAGVRLVVLPGSQAVRELFELCGFANR